MKSTWFPFMLLVFSILIAACAKHPYADSNRAYKKQVKSFARILREYPVKDSAGLPFANPWVGTTNFGLRRPNLVIIHHTAQNSCDQTLKTFTSPPAEVSSHYVICKDGTVHHMLHDLLRGHHAGAGKWGNTTDINSCSIGIELDNNGTEEFSLPQINNLLILLQRLKDAYRIPDANFIGHADMAPGRKVDPSRYFPWQLLAMHGFGYWYDTSQVSVPGGFDPVQALRIIGYDIRNAENAIRSYKLHFVSHDSTVIFSEADKKILADLVRKYQ